MTTGLRRGSEFCQTSLSSAERNGSVHLNEENSAAYTYASCDSVTICVNVAIRGVSIGRIVMELAHHNVGDYGDCGINDHVMNLIDEQQPAHVVLIYLSEMDEETESGICSQIDRENGGEPPEVPIRSGIQLDKIAEQAKDQQARPFTVTEPPVASERKAAGILVHLRAKVEAAKGAT